MNYANHRSVAWVFATEAEAKPFVEALALTKQCAKPFGFYSDDADLDEAKHILVISGMGALNASMAAAWLAGMSERSCVWINFGIGGTADKAVGALCLIHSVSGPLLERTFYPTIIIKSKWSRAGLESQAQPSDAYNELVFDMEASGFVCAAQRFVSKEYVHVIKVISDNAKQPLAGFNKDDCYALIKPHVADVVAFAAAVGRLGKGDLVDAVGVLAPMLDLPFRASHSQKRIVGELVYKLILAERWDASSNADLVAQTDARKAIADLQVLVNSIAPNFSVPS